MLERPAHPRCAGDVPVDLEQDLRLAINDGLDEVVRRGVALAGTIASFEADGGLTNKQNVRMELNGGYAVERIPAAVRIT